MDTVGTLGMLTTDMGVCRGGTATVGRLTWELAAIAALIAISFCESRFSRWLTTLIFRGSLASTPSTLER